MSAFDGKEDLTTYKSLLEYAAKASREIRCAQKDLDTLSSRLNFLILGLNTLIDKNLKGIDKDGLK